MAMGTGAVHLNSLADGNARKEGIAFLSRQVKNRPEEKIAAY